MIIYTGSPSVSIEQVYELSDCLLGVLADQGIGELDGHELETSGSDAIFYLYGPDAIALYLQIEDALKSNEITKTGKAYLRFGDVSDEDATEIRINVIDGLPNVH